MDTDTVVSQTIEHYEQFVNPALARLFRFMGLNAVEWEAQGYSITDSNGKEYIDCLGGYGVFSLGHRHPRVVAAVKRQLDRMPLSGKVLFNKEMADLAALLASITPGDLQFSFFGNSGAEAVEGALKLARLHTGRVKVVSTVNAFHGKTFGALSATGRAVFCEPFRPLLEGFVHVPYGDVAAMEQAVDKVTAAVIVEPVQGEGGIIVPSPDYLRTIRTLCDTHQAVMICDEVQTGLGRTGKMFAVEHAGVVPDILTLAKALGGGVMPIGAFIARPPLWEKLIASPFLHTSTFGGNPLACVAGQETIRVLQEEGLAEQAAVAGTYFLRRLTDLQHQYPAVIKEVRGIGLMLGLELAQEGLGGVVMAELISRGILVAYTLNNPKVIRLEPPLNLPLPVIDQVIEALAAALAAAADLLDEL